MQIRYEHARGEVAASLSTELGNIVITSDNKLLLSLTAAQTSDLRIVRCVYDLELVKDAVVVRLLECRVTVSAEVTRFDA